jgi:hypothetical protein
MSTIHLGRNSWQDNYMNTIDDLSLNWCVQPSTEEIGSGFAKPDGPALGVHPHLLKDIVVQIESRPHPSNDAIKRLVMSISIA